MIDKKGTTFEGLWDGLVPFKVERKASDVVEENIFNTANRQRTTGEQLYSDIPCNYGELSPIVKINILDSIINQASAVFGPYGGIYGELKGSDMMGGQEITEGGYEKSKDGHGFFNSIQLGSKYAQTIMKSIQQMTKYVAGYEGDTSRDGTTSVAIVGCNAAKMLLGNTLDCPEIPSTVQNMVFDILLYAGTDVIDKHKVAIYDENKHTYIGNGMKLAYDAIKTTVDGNRLFTEPFKKLMEASVDEGYNLLDCHLAAPNNIDAPANLELKVNAGIRFRASNLDKKTAGGFYNHQSYTFILDGYISPEHRDIYVYHLKKWLKHICGLKDSQGLLFADGRYDAPLIIVTRTPDYLEDLYIKISEEGVEVDNRGQHVKVRPKFMLGNNTESFKVYFDDMLSVFQESRIDLNRINKYIRDNKTTSDEIDPKLGMAQPVGQKELDLSLFFPTVIPGNAFKMAIPTSDEEWDEAMPGDQAAVFNKVEDFEYPSANVMLISNYDGQSLSLVPATEELTARANAKRDELLELKSSLSDLSLEDNMIPERLAFFSSCTIKPMISARSKDEYTQMFSLYEDALGVFQSVHKHGVMPGGNICLLKHKDEFIENYNSMINKEFENIKNDNKRKLYLAFAECVSKSLLTAYEKSLEILTKGDYSYVISSLKDNVNDPLSSYDIVTGEWNHNILEASRTTADVFASAVAMMKDMLQLKRIKLHVESGEHRQLQLSNKELALSESYKRFDKTR